MINNTDDFAYAIKDKNGFYYIGYNQWDKQLRKAKLYHSYKFAKNIKKDIKFIKKELIIIRIRITELEECNYE